MDIDLRDLQRLCRPDAIVGTGADGHQLKHQAHCRQKLTLVPCIRWNDMLAQQGTSTAQKKQIQVAQQLIELLK